ncbi:MAG: site-specific DNA-methyltransferase [Planctomycetia bacterium]|nr:site-specific DNA-methyltransferase [Planctomycetia bacterium]
MDANKTAANAYPERMKMESSDLYAQNLAALKALFPGVIAESRDPDGELREVVDFERLRELFDGVVVKRPQEERYEFNWVGKSEARADAYRPTRKTLRPCPSESVNWDATQNLYIEGDNLEVLKLLQASYLGKVKMIYIDPPYNTGHDFVYHDNFRQSQEEYDRASGKVDEDGIQQFTENTSSNPRFHSDWCSMIYPRLLLARNLLAEDGVIFISIDDNEVENLKQICNEVFGAGMFVAQIPWRKRTAKSDVPFGISQDYDWIVGYARSDSYKAGISNNNRKYFETDDFPGQPWRIHDMSTQRTATERPNSNFTIVNPRTGEEYPVNPQRVWCITKKDFQKYLEDNRIIFPGDYPFLKIKKPVLRYWKSDDMLKAGADFGKVAVSTKLPDEIGMSQDGTKEIVQLFKSKVFSYPKPSSLITYFLKITTSTDDVILDFFSGSATTAHAVMKLNAEDGGNRKYILVQLPETCPPKSDAATSGFATICEIGKERIRRAGAQILKERQTAPSLLQTDRQTDNSESLQSSQSSDLDIGFRVFKLAESNFNDVFYDPSLLTRDLLTATEKNIKEDRTDLDLLFSVVLDWGLPLSCHYCVETAGNATIHVYNNGDLIACFQENISEEDMIAIAKRKPKRALFRDSSFANGAAKLNLMSIFEQFSPTTTVKVL